VIPATVDYVRAPSLEGALAALADPEAKVLAGGQSLVSLLKLRVIRPTLLVDIGALELRGVVAEDGGLRVGALTVWHDLAAAPELRRPALAALADCALGIGDLQVRNRGTIGGSLVHADPASDLPAVALALGATLRLHSTTGERSVEATDFFLGPFTTSLAPGELVTEVSVPAPPPGSGSAYVSVEHPASGFALAGAAALVHPDGSRRVAVTGVGAQPVALTGDDPGGALHDVEIFGDDFAPAEYRRHLASVVVSRALESAGIRAQEDAEWQR
jgi:carbon-monoxide dehydrogenase medium subunit